MVELVTDDRLMVYGGDLRSQREPSPIHRHNNVELVLVCQGRVALGLGGDRHSLRMGQVALFWGGIPHRVIPARDKFSVLAVHIPMQQVFRMGLPREFIHEFMQGRLMVERRSAWPVEVDEGLFRRWRSDLSGMLNDSPDIQRVVAMEVQARVHRLVMNADSQRPQQGGHDQGGDEAAGHVEKMIQIMTEGYQLPLRVRDVAEGVQLNPNYASTLFHKAMGVTIMGFLTQLRVLHAQRMLACGNEKVLVVAMDSGFQTVSQFHAVFKKVTGQTPAGFRRQLLEQVCRRKGAGTVFAAAEKNG